MGHIQSLDDLVAFVFRCRRIIAAVALLGTLLSLVLAKSLPSTYEAAAAIQIEASAVGQADGSGQSTAGILQSIEQRLTGRANMLAVIERHGLYAASSGLTADQKIALLRSSITFQSVARASGQGFGAGGEVSAMIIFARSDNADQAARIANDFAHGLLDEGNASQAVRIRQTLGFYDEESRRVETEISELEAEVASYRSAHADNLPAARDIRQDETTGIEAEMRALERDLAGLRGQLALLTRGGLSRITDQRQFESLTDQIAVVSAQRQTLLSRKEQLQLLQADAAEVDRVLSGFERRRAQLQAQYDVVSHRLAEAETASRLIESRKSERITLLERAIAPEMPIAGKGRKLALLGVFVSLIFGVFVAFVSEAMRPVLRTAAQMERELGLRPIVSIPEISQPGRRWSHGLHWWPRPRKRA
jgi:tyrosine-protein kinase Etk/Wzc